MKARSARLKRDIAHYLATGHSDALSQAEPAEDILEGMKKYREALRKSLIAEVRKRSRRRHPKIPDGMGSTSFARRKLAPMVRGLFPSKEHEVVLEIVERSIIFLTREAALWAIEDVGFDSSAWQIANVYLCGIGAPALADGAFCALGLNEQTRCYVSLAYFEERNPFADYVVHEAAHIFHNTKRKRVGLPHTRYREWMLEIDFLKRETFAYTCEVYGRILERSCNPRQRRALLEGYGEDPIVADDRVDVGEHLDILAEAVKARNGWKRILSRCAPRRRQKRTIIRGVGLNRPAQ